MKKTLLFLTFLATAFFFVTCKQPKYTADNLPTKQLRWGNGGGFVGKEKTYILLENGQVFNRDMANNASELPKTKARKAKALFKSAESLGLAKLDFNHPGNVYYFIEFQEGDVVNRIAWGDPSIPVDKSIAAFYAELETLLKIK